MAAYAAVVSLMNTINNIQIHPRFSTCFSNKQIESLGNTAGFLLGFLESYNCGGRSKEVEDLEAKIASVAHAAEDVTESHIVDQILSGDPDGEDASAAHVTRDIVIGSHAMDQILTGSIDEDVMESHIVMCDLQKVTRDMDSIKDYITERFQDQQSTPPPSPMAASSRPLTVGKTRMVGFEEYLIQLMDKLTWQQSNQQVIPIVGMGGVGKTTLARNAFDHLLIKQHFDVRAWATISQTYSTREILLEILSSQEDRRNLVNLNEQELGDKLHKCLFNRRYLIILDDMWSIDVWDGIKFYFPDNSNGSRVVVTTRLLNVSVQLSSSNFPVNVLDEGKSWKLFCQETFGKESCPAELEELGKKICGNCKGLPLSIVVIGGFLRKSGKSREYWKDVARDTYSILNSEGDSQCMNILSLSYNYLPAHLKPCFLYMGTFAEDEEVLVSRLVKFWVAEGFLKPDDCQSLEEIAEGYVEDLVGRNLILVNRRGSNGKIRACKIHDLTRELCLSLAEKEKFLCVMKSARAINRERCIVIRESSSNTEVYDVLGSVSLVRSWICNGNTRLDSKLLRVLRAVNDVPNEHFLEADLSRVNLRCLDLQYVGISLYPSFYIPKKISSLWNLQTLRIEKQFVEMFAPSEIWEMVQLRHLQVHHLHVPDVPRNERLDLLLSNLQTLGNVVNFRLSEEVCKRIPNVNKLKLEYNELPQGCDAGSYYCPQNLGRFHKLQSLTLHFGVLNLRPMLLNMTFPTSLKKLSLSGRGLHWEDLEMIGSLPNLLKLNAWFMIGSEWNPVEGQFRRLKCLQIYFCETLIKWNADSSHFPVLEKLYLSFLPNLEEIPSGIGEIPTLQIIRLIKCSERCSLSTVKIIEEQQSLGNDDLRVEVADRKSPTYSGRWCTQNFFGRPGHIQGNGVTRRGFHTQNFFGRPGHIQGNGVTRRGFHTQNFLD